MKCSSAQRTRAPASMQALGRSFRTMRTTIPLSQGLSVTGPLAGDVRAAATKAKASEGDAELRMKDIVEIVSRDTKIIDKDCDAIIRATLKVIENTVAQGGKIQLTGFGTFKRSEAAAREGRNPRTGESLSIAASARPTFSAGKGFKDTVKESYKP